MEAQHYMLAGHPKPSPENGQRHEPMGWGWPSLSADIFLRNKVFEKHDIVITLFCCYNRSKFTKYETCAKLHRFNILSLSFKL